MIWLLRHGEAAEGSPDSERPLTPKGEEQARAAGLARGRLGVERTACLTSPKVRAYGTTRLLVAAWDGLRLRELMTQRVYTRLGKVIRKSGAMPPQAIEAETDVVATQVRHARELGAREIRIVATAAIRHAPNRDDLVRS